MKTKGQARLLQRKPNRLARSVYGELGIRVLVTCATAGRRQIFTNYEFADATLGILREQSERDHVSILAFCLMPDHIHLLLRVDGDVDVVRFVQAFKGKTTNLSWQHGSGGSLWQRSFHDHVLRPSEDEREHVRYILANPVRSGLVEEWIDYPFSGSFAYDLSNGL